jgi:AcrR family transcriptional regulator
MTSAVEARRRARLDLETVLTAAEVLVDAHGIDAVTMTMLAGELDASVSSLYNHVASLDELRAELQIRAIRLLGKGIRTGAMGVAGEEGLRKLADAFLTFARTYPQRYDTMTRPILDRDRFFEAGADAVEAMAAMIGSAGIVEDAALTAQMAFFAALHGFGSLEASGFFSPTTDREINLDVVYEQVVRGAVAAMLGRV